MLNIEKLSEKNLLDVLRTLFPTVKDITKKTFIYHGKRMIVDWYFEYEGSKFVFEFDGPTHFTRTKTQLRDLLLKKFCNINNINLIRVPYFIQIDNDVIVWMFGYDFAEKHNLFDKINTQYPHGFIDDTCILPADYNSYGQQHFCNIYTSFFAVSDYEIWNVQRSIYKNAHMKYSKEEFIGITPACEDIEMFWMHYPT